MTTIAYRDGVIAYDSRVTAGPTIVDDNRSKRVSRRGVEYFMCGCVSDQEYLIRWYQGEKPETPDNVEASAIIVSDGVVYMAGYVKDDGFFLCPLRQDNVAAMGSGEDHALTAMDMGADAKTAVKMAAKRDTQTGGRIRTFRVKQ